MALLKERYDIVENDIIRKTSKVRQLVDILQVDIASINDNGEQNASNDLKTRKKYEVFVTGALESDNDLNYPVTSSLFQTVFDQDYETQTANELLDIAIGCYHGSSLVDNALDKTKGVKDEVTGLPTGIDASGKYLFPKTTLMMREKINIYKQYAQYLLGDSDGYFTSPFETEFTEKDPNGDGYTYSERIDEAIFINFKRLFIRDGLVKDQFGMILYRSASEDKSAGNIGIISDLNKILLTDTNASESLRKTAQAGSVGTIKIDNPAEGMYENVGLIFYEKGIVVLDAKKIFDGTQLISGSINAVSGSTSVDDVDTGTTVPGSFNSGSLIFSGSLLPDLWVSGSCDNILDHVCSTRFGRSVESATALINQTFVNSTIYICRLAPSQGNYSRNPTYKDADGNIRVIEEKGDDPFAYITTIGLYDIHDNLLAVAKTSRPIEKNPEVDLSISVRLDY